MTDVKAKADATDSAAAEVPAVYSRLTRIESETKAVELLKKVYGSSVFGNLIGRGTDGCVYSIRDDQGRNLALKTITFSPSAVGYAVCLGERLRALGPHSWSAIVFRDQACVMHAHPSPSPSEKMTNGYAWYTMELMQGCISDVLHTLTDDHRRSAAFAVLHALSRIHELGYVHMDVKPANILYSLGVSGSLCVKLTDLDSCRPETDMNTLRRGFETTTLNYRAPELLAGGYMKNTSEKTLRLISMRCNRAIDIWSAGCVFWSLFMKGELPYDSKFEVEDVLFQYMSTFVDDASGHAFIGFGLSPELVAQKKKQPSSKRFLQRFNKSTTDTTAHDLLRRLLTVDPALRITANDALSHPYFFPLRGIKTKDATVQTNDTAAAQTPAISAAGGTDAKNVIAAETAPSTATATETVLKKTVPIQRRRSKRHAAAPLPQPTVPNRRKRSASVN